MKIWNFNRAKDTLHRPLKLSQKFLSDPRNSYANPTLGVEKWETARPFYHTRKISNETKLRQKQIAGPAGYVLLKYTFRRWRNKWRERSIMRE